MQRLVYRVIDVSAIPHALFEKIFIRWQFSGVCPIARIGNKVILESTENETDRPFTTLVEDNKTI